jgi:hypothetical protein
MKKLDQSTGVRSRATVETQQRNKADIMIKMDNSVVNKSKGLAETMCFRSGKTAGNGG